MIYEINGSDVYKSVQSGASFIINSADGSRALVSAEIAPQGVVILNIPDESLLAEMKRSPQWKQPCIGC